MKVIFLHGLGQDERSWKEVQEALAMSQRSRWLFSTGQ